VFGVRVSEQEIGLNTERFDYVIVGGGTAGCLLANRLSADPSVSVLLLEAGGLDNYLWIHIPVGYLYCIGNPRTDWMYQTEPEEGLGGRSIRYPRGRVLGGCSSINGMIYMRGQRADYDGWAAAGNLGWGWDDVLPWFIRHEDHHSLDAGAEDPLHGHGGEWRVERPRVRWAILDAFRQAAAQRGIESVDDFNRGDNSGCGYFEVNQRRGVRWNASKAFLKPVRHRSNLRVVTGASVTRLIWSEDGTRSVKGVEYRFGGTLEESKCALSTREVVLAAGAVGSAQLLQCSGIGPADVLSRAEIPVRHALPGVGRNLQDHLQLRLIYRVSGVPTLNVQAGSFLGRAKMALEYLLHRSGPLSMSPSQLGAFACSSPEVARADLEYHVQPLSLERFGEPLHDFPAFTASVCHLRPRSRGSIEVSSPDPLVAPRIAPNYLSAPEDRAVAVAAIRLTRRIVDAPALACFRPSEYLPGTGFESDEALAEAAGRIGTTIFHPVGSCKMGLASDSSAVVDARLRVHGIQGLRVVDASIMPTITSGNTNSPTLMIAERGAAMMLEDARLVR
jgi:choline dehydrogenase